MARVLVSYRHEAAALDGCRRHRATAAIGERHTATPAH
jgi:hypothetical protein